MANTNKKKEDLDVLASKGMGDEHNDWYKREVERGRRFHGRGPRGQPWPPDVCAASRERCVHANAASYTLPSTMYTDTTFERESRLLAAFYAQHLSCTRWPLLIVALGQQRSAAPPPLAFTS